MVDCVGTWGFVEETYERDGDEDGEAGKERRYQVLGYLRGERR